MTDEQQVFSSAAAAERNMQASASKNAGTSVLNARKAQSAISPVSTWNGQTNVATFLRCLRLLDLDLREDWPGVNEQLFSAKGSQQSLQQRVKCVEWSLYRLFDIWDPAYTTDVRYGLPN